ncbi:hypothetical protein ABK040_007378 [Willaertia magna]
MIRLEYYDRLIITIHSIKNVVPMDSNGFSDPFVTINFGGIELCTSIKKKTLQPVYEETFIWILDDTKQKHLPPAFRIEKKNLRAEIPTLSTTIEKEKRKSQTGTAVVENLFRSLSFFQNKKSGMELYNMVDFSQIITKNIVNNYNNNYNHNYNNANNSSNNNNNEKGSILNEINKDKLNEIIFTVWDYDRLKKNDFCGDFKLSILDVLNSDSGKFQLKLNNVESGELIVTVIMKFSKLCDFPNDFSNVNQSLLNECVNNEISSLPPLESLEEDRFYANVENTNFQKSEKIKYLGNIFYPLGWKVLKIDEMRLLFTSPTESYDPDNRKDCIKVELEAGVLNCFEIYQNCFSILKNFEDIPIESSTKIGNHYYSFLFQYMEGNCKLFQFVCVVDIGSACFIVIRYISNCGLKNLHMVHQLVSNSEFLKGIDLLDVLYTIIFKNLWVRIPFGFLLQKEEEKIILSSPLELRKNHLDRFEFLQIPKVENCKEILDMYCKNAIMIKNISNIEEFSKIYLTSNSEEETNLKVKRYWFQVFYENSNLMEFVMIIIDENENTFLFSYLSTCEDCKQENFPYKELFFEMANQMKFPTKEELEDELEN